MTRNPTLLLAGLALLLGGCSMAPKYTRPTSPIPSSWSGDSKGPTADADADVIPNPVADIQWQEFFPDQKMQEVIQLALTNNRDLRVAALNVEKAQALYRIQRAELLPTVGVLAVGNRQELAFDEQLITSEQYSVNLGVAAWELDLFGRNRSLKDAALERYFATQHARSAAQISLVAAVANSYLALAADRENLQLARSTLKTQEDNYKLIRQSTELGVASALDLSQARAQVEAARTDVAVFIGLVALDENALDLVTGVCVPGEMLPDSLESVQAPKDVPAGVSSGVLLQRPDILMAEDQLKAMNANIGAARAAFFPRITLTASAGTLSTELSGLFQAGTSTWGFGPQITLPIFTGGANRANLKAAHVDHEIGVAQYEKSIQTAFREVKDSLALRDTLEDQMKAQQSLVDAVGDSYRLFDLRYKAGIDGYLGVLIAQRSLFSAREQLVNIRLARFANRVVLYKVLGGGV